MKGKISILIIGVFFAGNAFSQDTWHDLLSQRGKISFKNVQQKFREAQLKQKDEEVLQQEHEGEYESDNTFYGRWEWYNRNRLDENGNLTNSSWRDLQAELELDKQSPPDLSTGNWNFLAPNQLNTLIPSTQSGIGRVNCIAYDNSGNIYLGTASGGLWKGTGNNTWTCLTNNIPDLSITSVCIDYTDNNIIYILTGDGDNPDREHDGPSIGILKSTDGGYSWSQTGFSFGVASDEFGHKLIMDPSNHQVLYVAGTFGLLQTTNGGSLWLFVAGIPSGKNFFDVEFKPGTNQVIYACTDKEFWHSITGGASWSQVFLPPTVNTSISQRMRIAVSANNANDVYVMAGSSQSPFFLGCCLSTDGFGNSFTLQSQAPTAPNIFGASDGGSTDNVSQADYDLAFAANPANVKELFFGGINIWVSEDLGVSWTKISSFYEAANDNMHPDQHDIEFNSSGDKWVGNDGGIFKYDPANITAKWSQQFNGLSVSQYYHLALDHQSGSSFSYNYVGAQDNGEQRYDGDDNNQIVFNGDGGDAAVDKTNDGIVYYDINGALTCQGSNLGDPCWPGSDDHTPYSTMASCACPDVVWNSTFASTQVKPDRPIVIDPTNKNDVYTGFNGIYFSNDQTNSFSICNGPTDGGVYNGMKIFNFNMGWAITPIFVVQETSHCTWKKRPDGLPNGLGISIFITGLEANNLSNPNEAWITLGGFDVANKVFHTTTGLSWTNITHSGLPNVPVNCIARDPNSSVNALYVGTDIGVFYTDDNLGGKWIPFRNGLPSAIVTDLEINEFQNMIYASTYGRGLWNSTLSNPCPASLTLSDTVKSNFALHEAGGITSSEIINKGYNQEVDYLAGSIDFGAGFDVGNGSTVNATIGTCDAVAPVHKRTGYLTEILASNDSTFAMQSRVAADDNLVAVFPNPASASIHIEYTLPARSMIDINLYDLQMHLLSSSPGTQSRDKGKYTEYVDVHSLPDGIYFLRLTIGNRSSLQKIIVQH